MTLIEEVFRQCADLWFPVLIYLSHYNEPLLDTRIVDIARLAMDYGHRQIRLVTNGDLLTPELARDLDGVLDTIEISVYGGSRQQKRRRCQQFQSMFRTTKTVFVTREHLPTHFNADGAPATETLCRFRFSKLILNHRGEYLLCCEEMIPHFGFGRFPEVSLRDYWWGEKHRVVVRDLAYDGHRQSYPYCASCPRVKRARKDKTERLPRKDYETIGRDICPELARDLAAALPVLAQDESPG